MKESVIQGCVHVYCGDGKGKTSAAIGLAIRAAGRGKRVLIARFLKNEDSGEVSVLRGVNGIQVLPCEKDFGFYSRMSDAEKQEASDYYMELFRSGCKEAEQGNCEVLILDEIMAVCNYGLLPEEAVLDWLVKRPKPLEVVMTGRDPSRHFKELADYVSVIQMEKHPFQKGIMAREGIEF